MNIKSTLALASVVGLALLALPAPADAQPQCSAPTVWGIACNRCYNPGAQTCCANGLVIPAGQFCAPPVSPGHPPVNPGGGGGGGSSGSSGGSGTVPPGVIYNGLCTANLLCPVASSVSLVRTPIAPAGWTSGQTATGHPTKIDENNDRMIGGTVDAGTMICMYGTGATTVAISRNRTEGAQKCFTIASYGDGFCCNQ